LATTEAFSICGVWSCPQIAKTVDSQQLLYYYNNQIEDLNFMNLAINLVLTSKYCSNFNLKVKGKKLSPQCFPTFAKYWLLNIM